MDSPNHFEMQTARYAWFLLPLIGGALMISWRDLSRLPDQAEASVTSPGTMPSRADDGGVERTPTWSTFVCRDEAGSRLSAGPLVSRFRLAGVFLGHGSGNERKRAVLDDTQVTGQRIVSELDVLPGDVLVRQIGRDFIVLSQSGTEEKLTMGFENPIGETHRTATHGAPGAGSSDAGPVHGTGANAYGGRQVSENRWLFDRQKLMAYYGQLRNEPERLLKVFDSLKPVYTPDRKIAGYRLKAEGERAFFDAVGLREGDVILSVNSLKMTSRRRAETLIREFVENRATAFVFEVERGGKPQTQIYSVP